MQLRCSFEDCEKSFPCQAKLQDHLNVHLGIRPFGCEICQKSFYSKKYLRAHEEIHQDKEIRCDKCSSTFTRRHNFLRHQKYCSIRYKCPGCSKIYKKRGSFESHLRNKHRAVDRTRSARSRRIVQCELCRAEFRGKSNLQAHHRAVHEKIRFVCKSCGKEFSYNSSLTKHLERYHSKDDR
jgi:KRAB domain-containing zinc finger protein